MQNRRHYASVGEFQGSQQVAITTTHCVVDMIGHETTAFHGKKKNTLKNNKNQFLLTKLFLFQWISIHWLPFSLAAHQLRTCEVGWNLEFTKFFFLPSSDSAASLDSSRIHGIFYGGCVFLKPLSSDLKAGTEIIPASGDLDPEIWRWWRKGGTGCQFYLTTSHHQHFEVALIPLKCQTLKRLVPVNMQHPHSWWIFFSIDFITRDYRHKSQPQESWEIGPFMSLFMSFLIESRTINS